MVNELNKTIISIIVLVSMSLILANISASEARNNIDKAMQAWNEDTKLDNDDNTKLDNDDKVDNDQDPYDNHKKSSSKNHKAKVTISLNDYGCYKGKVKATLKNVDLGITFFKNKVISLKHDNSETFKYNSGNSHYYDEAITKDKSRS